MYEHYAQSGQSKWSIIDNTRLNTYKYIIKNETDTVQTTQFTYRHYNSEPYGVDTRYRTFANPASNEVKLIEKTVYEGNASAEITSKEYYEYELGNSVNAVIGNLVYDGMFDLRKTESHSYKGNNSIVNSKRSSKSYHKITDPNNTDITYSHVITSNGTKNSNGDSTFTKFESDYLLTDYADILTQSELKSDFYFVVPEITKKD